MSEGSFQFNYSKRAINSIVDTLKSDNLSVSTNEDGTYFISIPNPVEKKPVQFKTQVKGTHDIIRAKQTGYDEATTEYKSSIDSMKNTVRTYENTILDQVNHARNFSPTIPAASEAKIESLRQKLDELQSINPPPKKYGSHCNDLRTAVYKCYQNNAQTPLSCSDVASQFAACIDDRAI